MSPKPARHRDPDPKLRLGVGRALQEEIRIATKVIDRGERDRIDPILEYQATGGRKPGDPMRERSDELPSVLAGKGSIDPLRSLRQFRIVPFPRLRPQGRRSF